MTRVSLAVLLVLLAATRVLAQPHDDKTEKARIHVKAGIAYYDEANYEDAAREMSAAYALRPLPDLQYNLAQCYERLNQLEDAAKAYEAYLAGKADAPERAQIAQRIENLRARAKAQAEGQKPPPPIVEEKVVFKTIVVYKKEPPPPGRAARGAAYGLGVLGLAGIGAGVAFAVLAKQAADEVTRGGSVEMPVPFAGAVRSAQESGRAYPVISGVTFGVGGLSLAGAIALYLVSKKIDREAPKVTLAPSFGPDGAGLWARGRF